MATVTLTTSSSSSISSLNDAIEVMAPKTAVDKFCEAWKESSDNPKESQNLQYFEDNLYKARFTGGGGAASILYHQSRIDNTITQKIDNYDFTTNVRGICAVSTHVMVNGQAIGDNSTYAPGAVAYFMGQPFRWTGTSWVKN